MNGEGEELMKACSAETVASPSGWRWSRAPVVTNRVHFCRSLQVKLCLAVPVAERKEGRRKKEKEKFKFKPQTKDRGAAELNETREERENKDGLFHHL